MLLIIEPKSLGMVGKYFTIELYSQPEMHFYILDFEYLLPTRVCVCVLKIVECNIAILVRNKMGFLFEIILLYSSCLKHMPVLISLSSMTFIVF